MSIQKFILYPKLSDFTKFFNILKYQVNYNIIIQSEYFLFITETKMESNINKELKNNNE
jgi:hypothetical protein